MAFARKRGEDGSRRRTSDAAKARREAARGSLSEAARKHVEEAAAERGIPTEVNLEQPDFGPYDIAVAPDDGLPRVDLGALKVPNLPDTSIGIEAAPNGQIIRVQLENAGSRLQLAAFAAPRTEGIWDEVREEIRAALLAGGAKVVDVEGDYGPELAARVTPQPGAPALDVRHVGIDGPRWFVHAVFVGPAATKPDQSPLLTALRGLVVERDREARPVKEALPLRLPAEAAEQLAAQMAAEAAKARAAQDGAVA